MRKAEDRLELLGVEQRVVVDRDAEHDARLGDGKDADGARVYV